MIGRETGLSGYLRRYLGARWVRKHGRFVLAILVTSLILFVSLSLANRRYRAEIEDLESRLRQEVKDEYARNMRERYQGYRELFAFWERAMHRVDGTYEFLVLLSKAVSTKIQIDGLEIASQDDSGYSVAFRISGLAKDGPSLKAFASRLNRKRGRLFVRADLSEIRREEDGMLSFKITGTFLLNIKSKESGGRDGAAERADD